MNESLEKIKQAKKDYQEQMKKEGESAIKLALKDFLANNPEVEILRWAQYTPYFNDGDPCIFGVSEVCVKLKGQQEKTGHNSSEEEFLSSWELDRKNHTELRKNLDVLDKIFHEFEDLFKDVFGDHAMVTVTPDNIEVEQYDHD